MTASCESCGSTEDLTLLDPGEPAHGPFSALPPVYACERCLCPVCRQGTVGYDTDAFDGRGGLNCPACWTEFAEGDGGKLVPARGEA